MVKSLKAPLFILGFLCLVWILGCAAFLISSVMQAPPHSLRNIQAIVVLTGGEGRIEAGLDLLRQGVAHDLLISGVHPDSSKPMIFEENNFSLDKTPCCITLGRMARSTVDNAQETKSWLQEKGFTRIVLVTSNYHMHRARMEFAFAMPGVDVTPYTVQQKNLRYEDWRTWFLLVREYHKFLFRAVQLITGQILSKPIGIEGQQDP